MNSILKRSHRLRTTDLIDIVLGFGSCHYSYLAADYNLTNILLQDKRRGSPALTE